MSFTMHDLFPESEAPVDAAESHVIRPISVDEVLDPDNTLPERTVSALRECTRFIQAEIQQQKRDAVDTVDAYTLDVRMSEARAQGKTSDIHRSVSREIDDLVMRWNRSARSRLQGDEIRWVRARAQDKFLGYDAIEPLRRDPRVTEILVTAPATVRSGAVVDGEIVQATGSGTLVEIGGRLRSAPGVRFGSDEDVQQLANEVLLPSAPITDSAPRQSGALPDGSRVEIQHRLITNGRSTFIALRRHPANAWTLKALIGTGTVSEGLACDIASWVRARLNVVLAGSTGSGKTSTQNAMLGFITPGLHVRLIEDTPEMNPPDFIYATRARTRPGGGGTADITIREHIRSALRSRPDILGVGESRGAEMVDVLKAMNTGHPGSFTTLHANSIADTVVRMQQMMTESGEVTPENATHYIATSVDLIMFQARVGGLRRITGVAEIVKPPPESTKTVTDIEIRPLWRYDRAIDEHVKVSDVSPDLLHYREIDSLPAVSLDEVHKVAEVSTHNTR